MSSVAQSRCAAHCARQVTRHDRASAAIAHKHNADISCKILPTAASDFRVRARSVRRACIANTRIEPTPLGLRYESASGVNVEILGVDHLSQDDSLGRFILTHRPHSVVLETGISPDFASATGNALSGDAASVGPSDAVYLRLFLAVAAALSQEADPLSSALWAEVRSSLAGEQLGVVAALATGARMVYGDRPKLCTYQRLLHMCSAADLDAAFGRRSAANYRAMLGASDEKEAGAAAARDCPVERVLMLEREAVLCYSIEKAAEEASFSSSDANVVALVGQAHLDGMADMLSDRAWQDLTEGGPDAGSATTRSWKESVWGMPPADVPSSPKGQLGVRRALAESVVGLRAAGVVVNDMMRSLGPVAQEDMEAYSATHELYGTCRMLLAPLGKALLKEVVVGRDCEMWDELADVRAVRPSEGGPGYDLDVLVKLRELNFDLG